MSTPPKKPAPADDDDSGVHKGFYEHSTGGKIPRAPIPAPKTAPKSLWQRVRAWFGR